MSLFLVIYFAGLPGFILFLRCNCCPISANTGWTSKYHGTRKTGHICTVSSHPATISPVAQTSPYKHRSWVERWMNLSPDHKTLWWNNENSLKAHNCLSAIFFEISQSYFLLSPSQHFREMSWQPAADSSALAMNPEMSPKLHPEWGGCGQMRKWIEYCNKYDTVCQKQNVDKFISDEAKVFYRFLFSFQMKWFTDEVLTVDRWHSFVSYKF